MEISLINPRCIDSKTFGSLGIAVANTCSIPDIRLGDSTSQLVGSMKRIDATFHGNSQRAKLSGLRLSVKSVRKV